MRWSCSTWRTCELRWMCDMRQAGSTRCVCVGVSGGGGVRVGVCACVRGGCRFMCGEGACHAVLVQHGGGAPAHSSSPSAATHARQHKHMVCGWAGGWAWVFGGGGMGLLRVMRRPVGDGDEAGGAAVICGPSSLQRAACLQPCALAPVPLPAGRLCCCPTRTCHGAPLPLLLPAPPPTATPARPRPHAPAPRKSAAGGFARRRS